MFVFSNTLQRGDMNIPLLNASKIQLFSISFSISILGKQNKKGRLGKQCYTLLNIFTCYIKSCKIWKCMVNTLQFTWMNDIKCHHFVSKITTTKEKPNTLLQCTVGQKSIGTGPKSFQITYSSIWSFTLC